MRSCAALCFLLIALTASVPAQDTVHVKTGWNIIGSVKAGAIPDVLSTVPPGLIITAFYGYEPGTGYQSLDTLKKGLGYWVKAGADGEIIFNTPPPPSPDTCMSKAFAYQGKFYNTVRIGNQCWMAQSLDAGTMIAGVSDQTDNAVLEKYCYNNDPVNCTLYGGLYQWNEAMQYGATEGAQGICPTGWHIPTLGEFQTLSSVVSGDGNSMKALDQGAGGGAGTNTSGFSALLAGNRSPNPPYSYSLGSYGLYWSSSWNDLGHAYLLYLVDNTGSIGLDWDTRILGISVRCIEN